MFSVMNLSKKTKREIFFILLFVGAAPLVYLNFFGSGGVLTLREHRADLLELEREHHELRGEVEQLREKLKRLDDDPRETERIAREEYNLARPGDIIINLPEKK